MDEIQLYFTKCGAVTCLSVDYILLGIEVVGDMQFVVTNGAMNFHWKLCYTSGTTSRAS